MDTRSGKKLSDVIDGNSSSKIIAKRIGSKEKSMEEELKKIKEQLAPVNRLNAEIQQLRAKQEKFDEMEREVQTMRLRYEQERDRTQCANDETNNQNCNITNLVVEMQKLNVDVKSKFSDEDIRHPIEYLNDLENYFKARNSRDSVKLLITENSLEGKAKYWFDSNKSEMTTFEIFKERFKKAFFSIPIQIKLKQKWQEKQYKEENEALEIFFLEQLRTAKYFEPKMPDFEINFIIAKQLPWRAREALAGADFENTQTIIARLQYLDLNPVDKDSKKDNSSIESNNKNEIRNLAVKGGKIENRENNKPNGPRGHNLARVQNQRFNDNNNRGYQQGDRQDWGSRPVYENQYRERFQNNNTGYNHYRQCVPRNSNNRWNYNNSNRYDGYNQNYRNRYWQSSNDPNMQWNAQAVRVDRTNQSWQKPMNSVMPPANPSDWYLHSNNNSNTNVANRPQEPRQYYSQEGVTNNSHLN